MKNAPRAMAAVLVGLVAASAAGSEPYRLGNVLLPREKTVGGTAFALHGAGFLRAGLLFRVYGAALYLERPEDAGRVLDDVPKRLEIFYLHNTPGKAMIDAAEKALARNVEPDRLAELRPMVDRLHAVYEDRAKGDVAALTYIPGTGTEFVVNGTSRVLIEGADFAAAYFTVWLGERPSSRTVKKKLLEKLP
jgi:hypothetical protein